MLSVQFKSKQYLDKFGSSFSVFCSFGYDFESYTAFTTIIDKKPHLCVDETVLLSSVLFIAI